MKGLILLSVSAGALILSGCGSKSSEPDEAKMHEMLSKPPSLEGMKNHAPKGAKQPANMPAAGGAPAPAPAAGP